MYIRLYKILQHELLPIEKSQFTIESQSSSASEGSTATSSYSSGPGLNSTTDSLLGEILDEALQQPRYESAGKKKYGKCRS